MTELDQLIVDTAELHGLVGITEPIRSAILRMLIDMDVGRRTDIVTIRDGDLFCMQRVTLPPDGLTPAWIPVAQKLLGEPERHG